MRDTTIRDDIGVRSFDVFCPANFANTLPWIASLELLLGIGIGNVADWDQQLVDLLVDGIDPDRYQLLSPVGGPSRSTLVVLGCADNTAEVRHRQLIESGIDTAFREGNLRLSVRLFNSADQITQTLEALHAPVT